MQPSPDPIQSHADFIWAEQLVEAAYGQFRVFSTTDAARQHPESRGKMGPPSREVLPS